MKLTVPIPFNFNDPQIEKKNKDTISTKTR